MSNGNTSHAAYTKDFYFSVALTKLLAGERLARAGWNGKNMYIHLQVPDAKSKMTLPYLYMYTAGENLVPWLASQSDILTEDWFVV